MKTSLRRASNNDYRAFYGKEPIVSDWVGFCAERDGRIIAFAFVFLDAKGRAWCGIDNADEVPSLMLHRTIRDFFRSMAQEGIPALYASCDERIPRAAAWLRRLGFAIDATMPCVYMPSVDKMLPVWKRTLLDAVPKA